MRKLKCSNCGEALRPLKLEGHYGKQVEVDVCDPCCLIWFDDVESVRIAKAGIADLVRTVHAAMSQGEGHGAVASQAHKLDCPVCTAPLRQVYNASRYGRTSQLQCPNRHGYYQSYILYLAEKGYLRPIIWSDIKALIASARELFCGNCGGALALRPQDACPYCQSSIAVLDPARLASAVSAGEDDAGATADQQSCHACGCPLDPTRHICCPQCHAALRRRDTQLAADAVSRPATAQARHREKMEKMDSVLAAPVVQPARMRIELESLPVRTLLAAGMLLAMVLVRAYVERGDRHRPDDPPPMSLAQREAMLAGTATPAAAQSAPVASRPAAAGGPCAYQRDSVRLRAVALHGVEGSPSLLDEVGAARLAWEGGMPYEEVLRQYGRTGIDGPLFGPGTTPELARGAMPEVLADVAFCLPPRRISAPVYSGGYYYLLQLMDAR